LSKDVKRIGDAILAHVRFVIREIADGDADFEFKLNRWIHSRLLSDSRKTSELIKHKLWDSGMQSCQICKKKFSNIKGVEIHRKDSSLGYSVKNCELLCNLCHRKPNTDNASGRPPGRSSSQDITEPEEPFLEKVSKRHKGKSFLYWWDISPGFLTTKDKHGGIKFVQQDSVKCCVSKAVLKGYLTPERMTSRKKWGVRVLKGREGELAFEPPSGGKKWLFLPVECR